MISIVIVGYNSKKDLEECFDSIFANTYKKFRVIFVDNDSSDGSFDFVKKSYPQIEAIKNDNTGYAGGNNVGIKKALELKSDYIFLLNPDTIIDKECLSKLVLQADQKTVLQPLILLSLKGKNTDLINTTGGHLNFLGFSYCSQYREHKSAAKAKDVALASGAAAFIPANVVKTTGLLDESFFMYHEDVDYFWRSRLLGFNIRLVPDALVWHKYLFSKNNQKMFYAERNRLVFLYKNFSLKYLILIFPALLLNELLMLVYSLLAGWFGQKIQSYASAVKLSRKELRFRKDNLTNIHKQEKKLQRFIKPEIKFSEINNPAMVLYSLFTRIYWFLISWLV